MTPAQAIHAFHHTYHRPPTLLARAPGRVNLIGEHTDYNDGFVLPAAIHFAVHTALAPRSDRFLHAHADNLGESVIVNLDDPGPPLQHHWSDYLRGIAVELEADGFKLQGTDVWFTGEVPLGAGLSSSAALEMSLGLALLSASGHPPDLRRLALAGQRAEHHFAGTHCGIMDQFVSAHAQSGHAVLLDCRSLESTHVPIPNSLRLVVCNTRVKHRLAGGEYNVRRAQCEEGVRLLQSHLPHIRALRDVTLEDLQRHGSCLTETVLRRCRHVVSENHRVLRFADALASGRLEELGPWMAQSHASLRDDYSVSCPELDALVDAAHQAPRCLGSRMTGGGFGGCTINLVHANHVDAFQAAVAQSYQRAFGSAPRIWVTSPAAGVSCQPLP